MTDHGFNRRETMESMLGMGVAALAGLGAPLAAASAVAATTEDGLDDFITYMKLYSSMEPGRHWWWFTGRWDLILPGQAAVPVVGFDTLIRREVTREADDVYVTRGWEGMVFWDLKSRQLIERMTHPITGREIVPFLTKEGPTNTRTSPAGFHVGAGAEGPRTLPIAFPRVVAGGDVWIERAMQAKAPHPMKPAEWKWESSGDSYWTNLVTVLRGKVADVRNPGTPMAPADYVIGGQSVPVPWMLMGSSGASLGWTGYGRKFATLEDLPAKSRAWYEAKHPELFAPGEPWTAYSNAFLGYMATRKPVTP
jgi:hypothetical protein